jgi:hypothetical protein
MCVELCRRTLQKLILAFHFGFFYDSANDLPWDPARGSVFHAVKAKYVHCIWLDGILFGFKWENVDQFVGIFVSQRGTVAKLIDFEENQGNSR